MDKKNFIILLLNFSLRDENLLKLFKMIDKIKGSSITFEEN